MSHPTQKTKKEIYIQNAVIAWDLRQKMWTQERIAKHLGMSQTGVADLLKRIGADYRKNHLASVEAIKEQQISQLESIADESMQAWEKSKGEHKSKTLRQSISKDSSGKTTKKDNGNIVQSVEDQNGDPRYLTVAMKAKEDIRKIIGADAPTKIINEDSPLNAIQQAAFNNTMTVEEAKQRYQDILK